MLTTEERIRALIGNIKNWSWDIYPKFSIDKEDAIALLDYLKRLSNDSNTQTN